MEDRLFRLSENNGELVSEQGVAGSRGTACSTEDVFILPSEGEGDDGDYLCYWSGGWHFSSRRGRGDKLIFGISRTLTCSRQDFFLSFAMYISGVFCLRPETKKALILLEIRAFPNLAL